MPTVGDVVRGSEIGKTGTAARSMFVWANCPSCNEDRWAQRKSEGNPVSNTSRRCKKCAIKHAKQFSLNTEKAAREGRI
jgi:hypothetical protein|tara:strand:+ start:764 stop:1000 length:237 start_codon:yes stop_codon:yes gene_type:complete